MEKKRRIFIERQEVFIWLFTLLGMYISTALLLFLLAFLVFQFQFGEKIVSICIPAVYVAVNFWGGYFMGKKKKVKKYLIGLITGVLYFAVLVVISLICNHGLQDFAGNFFTTLAICAGAATLGGMLG